MRVFNFAAGPATLPLEVLEQVRAELTDWGGSGMSVMEVSHRSKAFVAVAERAEADLRELMGIPANYKVLFLQGGASGQFSAIPMNLTRPDSTVDFVNTGNWSKKALGEAKRYCKVNVVADEAAGNYSTVPEASKMRVEVSPTPSGSRGGPGPPRRGSALRSGPRPSPRQTSCAPPAPTRSLTRSASATTTSSCSPRRPRVTTTSSRSAPTSACASARSAA